MCITHLCVSQDLFIAFGARHESITIFRDLHQLTSSNEHITVQTAVSKAKKERQYGKVSTTISNKIHFSDFPHSRDIRDNFTEYKRTRLSHLDRYEILFAFQLSFGCILFLFYQFFQFLGGVLRGGFIPKKVFYLSESGYHF